MTKSRWLILGHGIFILILAVAFFGCGDDDDSGGDDDNGPADDDQADDDVGDDDATDDDTTDDDTTDDDETPDDDTADDDTADDDTADDDSTPSDADPFIESGKAYLRAGEGNLARVEFNKGREADPLHEGCWYGLVLADALHDFDTISIIVSYVEMVLGYQPPSRDIPQTGQGFIDDLINIILDGMLFQNTDELVAQVEKLRQEHPDVIFPLDRMPIILNFEEVADAHGDYDFPDAQAAEAFAQIFSGLAQHLTALNLDFNLGLLFELTGIDWGSLPIDELLGLIVDYALALVDDPMFPDFLTLKNDAADFKAAGLETGLGWYNAADTFALLIAETGSQDNEVLGYDDANGNLQWDENEHLIIPSWGVLDDEQNNAAWAFHNLFGHLADSFLDYTVYDTDPENPQPFKLFYLNEVLDALGLPGLIPDWEFLTIDFGAMYRDADPTAFKDQLLAILYLIDAFLP